MLERLHKVMARAGIDSRRACEDIITSGRVKVNGQVVTRPGTRVDPETDRIEVDGRLLPPPGEKLYYLLYKPRGYITTTRDPQGRPPVTSLLPFAGGRLFPVGRLDKDTEGLLIITNDGDLAYLLTHPRHEFPKTYEALVKGVPSPVKLDALRNGIYLEDGLTAPAKIRLLGREGRNARLEITLHEGRKRQVRRMCRAIGHPVLHLRRTRLGFLTLKGLSPGEYRSLSRREVDRLFHMATRKEEVTPRRRRSSNKLNP